MATTQGRYHHGDLRAELIRVGYDLACRDGVESVTLRAVTRIAGVSPSAAYRHFQGLDDLRVEIGLRALASMAAVIEEHLGDVPEGAAGTRARLRLEAVGTGYIAFALDHPRAFQIGLFGLLGMADAGRHEGAGSSGRTPYQLLTDALSALVDAGELRQDRVASAAVHCWASVHGFASLATQGPMSGYPRRVRDDLARQLVRDVVGGVLATGRE